MQIDQGQVKTFTTCESGIFGGSGKEEKMDTKFDDPGTWPLIISNKLRKYCTQNIVPPLIWKEFIKNYQQCNFKILYCTQKREDNFHENG